VGDGKVRIETELGVYMQNLVVSEVDRWRKILVGVNAGE
jgi:hypothetical protein